jgi:hypothetical protein|tara:strand:+ start:561 stop:935 length:375 start_codon:yes stop_codon:yes gene_type:complete
MLNNPLLLIGGIALIGYLTLGQRNGGLYRYSTPNQYAGFFGAGTSTLEEEILPYAGFFGAGTSTLEEEIPYAGFFGAGSSKLEDPPLPTSYSNARPSAGFLSMSSPIQEDLYGPDSYVPWHLRG